MIRTRILKIGGGLVLGLLTLELIGFAATLYYGPQLAEMLKRQQQ